MSRPSTQRIQLRGGLPRNVIIAGERIFLRRPRATDEAEWVEVRARNRAFLEKWEPRFPGRIDRFGRSGFRMMLKRGRARNRLVTLVCHRATGEIIGMLTLNEIVRGAFQSATMGYWISRDFARQGLMTEAVRLMLRHSFATLDMHRVEANMMPRNAPSRCLAAAVGMRYEGTAKRYLQIAGKWEDHERWAITIEEWHALLQQTERITPSI